jgi:cobalt-precorrin 5A hydrolase
MKTALVALSPQGAQLISCLARADDFAGADVFVHTKAAWTGRATRFERIMELTGALFQAYRAIVLAAPCGVVVRAIAPHLRDKHSDPAVVVVDAGGRFAVSLLCGHEGGGNDLAVAVANVLGAEPIVTTTTEAVKDLVIGIGCRRGCAAERIVEAVTVALDAVGMPLARVRVLASADLKADEAGLREAARALRLPLRLIAGEEIRGTCFTFARNPLAERKVGLPAVAEPCALLAGRRTTLLLHKTALSGVTVAVAQERLPWSASAPATLSTVPAEPSEP